MKLLVDTNIVLDVLLARKPHAASSAAVLALIEKRIAVGLLSSHTVTTVFYLTEKSVGAIAAREHIKTLLLLFDVAPVGRATLVEALDLKFSDFEDAVLYQAGLNAEADAIVTRNQEDFSHSELPVYSPDELLAALAASEDD